MKVAHLVPISCLRDEKMYGDYFYALAHIVLQSKEYADFFLEKSREGELVLLDNSAYELGESISDDKLLAAVERVEPSYVYAPDVVGDAASTCRRTFEFVSRIGKVEFDSKVIGVVHGDTVEERVRVFSTFVGQGLTPAIPPEDYLYPVSAGVSDFGTRVMYKRIHFCDFVEFTYGAHDPPHAFLTGLGNPIEVACNDRSWILGVDSTTCCVHGGLGESFDPALGISKQQVKLDFFTQYHSSQLRCIYYNVETMKLWSSREEVSDV